MSSLELNQQQVDHLYYNAYDLFGGDGSDDLTFEYTGRGMVGYGGEPSRTCFGYTGEDYALVAFELGRLMLQAELEQRGDRLTSIDGEDALYQVSSNMYELGAPSRDAMGRGTIYYWRNVTVAEGVKIPREVDEWG